MTHKQTMIRVSPTRFESPERLDGRPDLVLYRDGRMWVLDLRTSAKLTCFDRLDEALAYITDMFAPVVPPKRD
jgi:hypothetical protein